MQTVSVASKLDGVALLVADPPHGNTITDTHSDIDDIIVHLKFLVVDKFGNGKTF